MSPAALGNRFLCPTRVKTLATFTAEDPWNQNRVTTFLLEAYVGAARGTIPRPDVKPPLGVYLLGLRSEADGVERMLPESLSELWRLQRLQAEKLPSLLQQMQPDLKKQDYQLILCNHSLRKTSSFARYAIGFAVLVFVTVGILHADTPEFLGLMAALSLGLGGGAWFQMNRLYFRPKARRERQMEWALSRS